MAILENSDIFQKLLDLLYQKKGSLIRIPRCPMQYIDFPNWKSELEYHANEWKKNKNYWTFHHIRKLYEDISANGIKFPCVAKINSNNKLSIDPGGSRCMVAMMLKLDAIPIDYIVFGNRVIEKVKSMGSEIKTVDQFMTPYSSVNSSCNIQTTRSNIYIDFDKVADYNDFWFTFDWHNMKHFWKNNDIDEFNLKYHDSHGHELIDYYKLKS